MNLKYGLLAATLRRIAEQGPEDFYSGITADLIVAQIHRGDGLISKDDQPVHSRLAGTLTRELEELSSPFSTAAKIHITSAEFYC